VVTAAGAPGGEGALAAAGALGRDGALTPGRGGVAAARVAAESVTDPELPMLTLADLGVLRDVRDEDGTMVVTITPTYTACPALGAIRDDLARALRAAGCPRVEVRTALAPAWSTDQITPAGRRKLAAAGIAPPGPAPRPATGPVPLALGPRPAVPCPRCGSADTRLVSTFGATACRSLHRCVACLEPFEHVREM
jgi:ring-1,2-phenylacetyl-CoA epoxidase subunit PaaD